MRAVTLLLLTILIVGCTPGVGPLRTLEGVALAGPTCPVVTDPPDPACADRPVAGAEMLLRDPAGEVIARTRTNADGRFTLAAPAGRYELVAGDVAGLLGTPSPIEVELGTEAGDPIVVAYDTGIR